MPDVAEEALLAMSAKQPIFLVGGCARDIAETLGIADRWAGSRGVWKARELFDGRTEYDLNNGLTRAENQEIAATPQVDRAIILVLVGLRRLRSRERMHD